MPKAKHRMVVTMRVGIIFSISHYHVIGQFGDYELPAYVQSARLKRPPEAAHLK